MATSKALNAHAAFAGNYYGSVVIGQQINRNDGTFGLQAIQYHIVG
jgi:hypothetical protein